MRLLLVCVNRERHPFPVAPLGALFIAQAARAAGHAVQTLDLGPCHWPERSLRQAIRRERPDAIGFSIRNLDNCYWLRPHSYVASTARLAAVAREAADAATPLIAGGSGFSMAPRRWMQALGADYGVIGEGEAALPALLTALESGIHPAPSPGVLTRDATLDVAFCHPAPRPDTLGAPAHGDCRYRPYLRGGGFIGIQSKRGCPFSCIYCIYPKLEGSSYRLRAPEAVADEMETVIRAGQGRDFYFTDSVFNAPRSHALAVCATLARRSERLSVPQRPRWMAMANPVGFDAELARAMRQAGCIGLEFGLDGVTERMLDNLGKPFGQDQIVTALDAARTADIPFAVHLLFGGPGETLDDLRATGPFLDQCAPARGVFASIGIRVLAGTPLEAIARREGRLEGCAPDLFEPVFYVSEGLGGQPLTELDRTARQREEWSSPLDWEKPALRAIQAIVNRAGQRPQWLNARNYGRHIRRKLKGISSSSSSST